MLLRRQRRWWPPNYFLPFLLSVTLSPAAVAAGEEGNLAQIFAPKSFAKFYHSLGRLPLRMPEALRLASLRHNSSSSSINNSNSRRPRQVIMAESDGNGGFVFNGMPGPDDEEMAAPTPVSPGVYSCGHTGSDVFMNFINPSFPDSDDTVGSCVFKIRPNRPEICQIRVDFVDAELLDPKDGNCITQFLQVAGPIWPVGFTRLCGVNSDQHFYVHLNPEAEGETIDLIINTVTRSRYKFGFWITQIDCSVESNLEAPPGCTQYHLGDQGTIKTFNFEGMQYLTNTNYKICIKSELNACYMVFQVDSNQFYLQRLLSSNAPRGSTMGLFRRNNRNNNNRDGDSPAGRGSEECGLDYIMIPGGRANASRIGTSYDRFCGGRLNIESGANFNSAIYAPVTSEILTLQLVTGVRDEAIMEILNNPRNNRNSNGIGMMFRFNLGAGNRNRNNNRNRNRNNDDDEKDGTGAGMRLRYSQLRTCLSDDNIATVLGG